MTALFAAVPAAGPFAEDPAIRGMLVTVWFLLLGALLAGYAILDGFDLGVGIIHLFVPRDEKSGGWRSTPSGRSGTATRSGW